MNARATRRSLPGLIHLAVRQLASHRAIPLTLALVIAFLAALGTMGPRWLRTAENAQADFDLAAAAPLSRDVTTALAQGELAFGMKAAGHSRFTAGEASNWAGLDEGLLALRASLGEPLASALGEPMIAAFTGPKAVPPASETRFYATSAVFIIAPSFREFTRLTAGRWPSVESVAKYKTDWQKHRNSPDTAGGVPEATVEIALAAETAKVLKWEVGASKPTEVGSLRLVGTYEALSPHGSEWLHLPNGLGAYLAQDPNRGVSATFAAVISPAYGKELPSAGGPSEGSSLKVTAWYPVTDRAPTTEQLKVAAGKMSAFLSSAQSLGKSGNIEVRSQFSSNLAELFNGTLQRASIVRTLLFVLALGPGLIGIAVLVLGTRLLVERRRRSLTQLSARGAGLQQLAITAAGEGLALAIPAAALGAAAGTALSSGPVRLRDYLIPALLVGLTTALLVGATRVGTSQIGVQRHDLGASRRRAGRLAEGGVAVTSAGLLLLTLQQLASPGIPGYLALAGPVAAIALAVILVLRLYPGLVALLDSQTMRRNGISRFIAFARARRSPSGGVTPVIGLVSGVSVALLAALLASTVAHGSAAHEWGQAGGDVRVSGPAFSEEDLSRVLASEGVTSAARLGTATAATAEIDGARTEMRVVIADTAKLAEVQRGAAGVAPIPPLDSSGVIQAYALEGSGLKVGTRLKISGHDAEIVGAGGKLGGLPDAVNAIVIDGAAAERVAPGSWRPNVLLIDLREPAARQARTLAELRSFLPPSRLETREQLGANFTASPLGHTMRAVTWAALGCTGFLVALALVLTQMLTAPSRVQVTAILRTLGMRRKGARRLAALELAPTVGTSVVVGLVVGWLVALLVVATTNLAPLTGGKTRPGLWADLPLVGAVIAGVVVVSVVVVVISAWAAGRADVARHVKVGDE